LASPGEYYSLQPVLRYLHAQSPEPNTTVRTLTADRYKVVFNETDEPHELDGAFAWFNSYIFGSSLPETKIRYATSIQSPCEPGWPIGVLAQPDDAVTCRIPGQFQIDTPHVFITEKLRRLAPVNEDDRFVRREDGEWGLGLDRSADGLYTWNVLPLRLTASGHEFAQAMENSHGFQAVKRAAEKSLLPASLSLMRDVAVGALRAELAKHGFLP
jgi:hypothetical protein